MTTNNRITNLLILNTHHSSRMIWNSGWRLASAMANSGGLGLVVPDLCLRSLEHIQKCKKKLTNHLASTSMLYRFGRNRRYHCKRRRENCFYFCGKSQNLYQYLKSHRLPLSCGQQRQICIKSTRSRCGCDRRRRF